MLIELQADLPGGSLVKQLDVSDTDAVFRVLGEVFEEMGDVDLVVYAAGCGNLNPALDWQEEKDSVATNAVGFASVANITMKYFMEKKKGHLVAISSMAALRGGKASPAYNASKAFISSYLEGLRQKVTGMGLPVIITDIKPGFVDTAMAKGEGLFWVASAEKAARQIYSVIQNRRSHAYVTKRWRLIAWLLKIMPDALYNRL